MLKGFWKKTAERAKKENRPILIAAPMANVTDAAFRRMLAKYGKTKKGPGLDVLWTEFVSCDGLCSKGKKVLMTDLIFDKSEHPIVAQFFGSKPENFYKSAKLAKKLGFDGIDINMGCPDRGIMRQGGGADLIKNPKLAQEIIRETVRGAGGLPVSVKTRIGFNEIELDKWLPYLLEMDLAAITIHGRTKKEMSMVPAHWDIIAEAVKMRNESGKDTLIIGNGDVSSLADAQEKYEKYGVDGVMIGRGIFGQPWFFNPRTQRAEQSSHDGNPAPEIISLKTSLKIALEHTLLFEKTFKGRKNFETMKKHYRSYVSGFDNAKNIRMELMNLKSLDEGKKFLRKMIKEAW